MTEKLLPKNHPKLVNAWCSYDWANSVYNLIITSTIFPVYYGASTEAIFGDDGIIPFFGWEVKNTVIYSYAISFSFMVIVFLSPILSGIADYSGKKKRFMKFFTYLGSLSCMSLYFFTGENVEYGLLCSVLASIGYAGSLVFYNAFLPEISTQDQMDRISARGFSMGYIGSVVLLLVNLVMITQFETFGFADKTAATKISFLMVGVWWMGFAQIGFYFLKDKPTGHKVSSEVFGKGFKELKKVFGQIQSKQAMIRFLLAFFLYSMGVQTVMLLAPLFGQSEVGMEGDSLILTVLILQLVAIVGAILFAKISDKKGNKFSISITLVIWILVCLLGSMLTSETHFYILAGFLGLVMGGVQSMSRSTYSKMIPNDHPDTASFFSFYDITEKLAIVIGTLTFGFVDQLTNMRNSLVAMSAFFILGLILLTRAKLPKGKEEEVEQVVS
ncbi:MFS transporter [Rapidithrix thailandica]|uniref:MFS transporter n=1 Tax=Rapidithrix thailandica TaxID=413964 RepID=A0AAW9S4H4_9BACT